jgi:ribosome-associated toxin RatA of RatAB toxin-antitoxin module
MKRSRLLTLAAFAIALPFAVLPAAAQAGSPTVSDELRNGKIETTSAPHPGTNVQWGRAVALVDAPIDDVMAVIQNYAGYKTFLPHFEESRVLSQRGASALVYIKVSVMHGATNLWAEVKLHPRPGDGPTRVIEGAMTKGNMDHFEALWEVTPVEGGTLVAFQILVDPSIPLPASLINDENQASARKTLRALRTLLQDRKATATKQ